MAIKKGFVNLDKKDNLRPVLTDTAPGDTPIAFSNDGFYLNLRKGAALPPPLKAMTDYLVRNKNNSFKPYKYKIFKNDKELRTLSLLHPSSQLMVCDFYEKYSHEIVGSCSRSEFSIRSPNKIGSSFFEGKSYKQKPIKETGIDTVEEELKLKYASSYFSYRGYSRPHSFFESEEYIRFEELYSELNIIDVSHCFSSIYTHSLAWAVEGKEFTKKYMSSKTRFTGGKSFVDEFDKCIRNSNDRETKSIPIGPEVSRIFAEIILQDVDEKVRERVVSKFGYKYNEDYVVRRYVDDYFVFSRGKEVSEAVLTVVSSELSIYGLFLNRDKSKCYSRPFSTDISNAVTKCKDILGFVSGEIFSKENIGELRYIKRPKRFSKNIIDRLKVVCADHGGNYSLISGYIISSLSSIASSISGRYMEGGEVSFNSSKNAIYAIFDVIFFMMSVSPSVASSSKLSKSLLIVDHNIANCMIGFLPDWRLYVVEKVKDMRVSPLPIHDSDGFVFLERINLSMATHAFDPCFSFKEESLTHSIKRNNSYFSLISLVFYIKDKSGYETLRQWVSEVIRDKLVPEGWGSLGRGELNNLLGGILSYSENIHLLYDLLSCPYIDDDLADELIKIYVPLFNKDIDVSEQSLEECKRQLRSSYWFVKWEDVNLIKLLERSELKPAY